MNRVSDDVRTAKDVVQAVLSSPIDRALVFWDGGFASCPLPPRGTLVFGRHSTCDIRIDHPSISRKHVALIVESTGLRIVDLGSANGSRIGGRSLPANEPTPMNVGEMVELGAALLIVHIALGVLSRSAPQFNLLTTGFPVILATGLAALALSVHVFAPVLRTLLEQALDNIGRLLQALAAI